MMYEYIVELYRHGVLCHTEELGNDKNQALCYYANAIIAAESDSDDNITYDRILIKEIRSISSWKRKG